MKLTLVVAWLVAVAGFPSVLEPTGGNLRIVKEAQKVLDLYPGMSARYNMTALMISWARPIEEMICEEWASAVSLDPNEMKYTWCGDRFCVEVCTTDDVVIRAMAVAVY